MGDKGRGGFGDGRVGRENTMVIPGQQTALRSRSWRSWFPPCGRPGFSGDLHTSVVRSDQFCSGGTSRFHISVVGAALLWLLVSDAV